MANKSQLLVLVPSLLLFFLAGCFSTIWFADLCSSRNARSDPQSLALPQADKTDVILNALKTGMADKTDVMLNALKKGIAYEMANMRRSLRSEKVSQSEGKVDSTELSALWDDSGSLRKFKVSQCPNYPEVTLPDLYEAFAAHQVEWNQLGKDRAWWSVLTGDEFLVVDDHMKAKFYASGAEHVRMVREAMMAPTIEEEWRVYATVEPHNGNGPRDIQVVDSNVKTPFKMKLDANGQFGKKVLDFGCGLGRLAVAFAGLDSECTCVDQSVHHLRLAKSEWEHRRNEQPRTKIEFLVSSPDLLAALKGQRFDFVHSVIVLQHMVAPLQAVYLEQFCDILRPGGQGFVQIPLYLDQSAPCDVESSISIGGMQMHYTPAQNIVEHMSSRGCEVQVLSLAQRYMGQGQSGLVLFRKES